ncbi:MAG: redox-regulated ATPase YchF [Patescibacteria group bacterium]
MSLKIGIVGLPNVGKSTLFQALTKKEVDISNYPFCTIEPNIGVVAVPDERVKKLADFFHSEKIVPAIIEFVDIAGLVKGASEGEGLGNKFLSHIRDVDAILYMVRFFENPDIIHVEKTVDPIRDIDIITTELLLKDLETIQKRREGVSRDAKKGAKEAVVELELLEELEKTVGDQRSVFSVYKKIHENTEKIKILKSFQLLTGKPVLFVINTDRGDIPEDLKVKIISHGGEYALLNAKNELDSVAFSSEERTELGLPLSQLDILIKKSYTLLNLITFLTTGPDETRAWTIVNGVKAPSAAGTIHSDFEKKFIRADTIAWNELLKAGGWAEARAKGIVRAEGKEYIIHDGDVLEIKHS